MTRSAFAAWLAALLVASSLAACSGGSGDAGPEAEEDKAAPPAEVAGGKEERLPLDPEIDHGTLDNGLTYYIRENQDPGGRAQLRLVVKAGSANETPEQSGAAHFLEHMLFNGTEEYPHNELTEVLARFGTELGPDLNAYTTQDETVYMLEAETDEDNEDLSTGIDVLAQWAGAATLDPEEVERERGVVANERRSHLEEADGRTQQAYEQMLFAGTPYEDRDPIGHIDSIEGMSADTVRAFYDTWYRPDRMAVVVVGDFDGAEVRALIEDRFGALAPRADARSDPRPASSLEPEYAAYVDEELGLASVRVVIPIPDVDYRTAEGLENSQVAAVAHDVLENRLTDDVLRDHSPLHDVSIATIDAPYWGFDGLLIDATVADEDIEAAARTVLSELERLRRDGVTERELHRVVTDATNALNQNFGPDAPQQDYSWAARSVYHFLGYGSVSSPEETLDRSVEGLTSLDRDAVASWASALPPARVFAAGPSLDELGDDPEGALADVVAAVADADLEPRPDGPSVPEELVARPDGAPPVPAGGLLQGYDTYELANGAQVHVVQDERFPILAFYASSDGGTSVLDDADAFAAGAIPAIVGQSTLGDFDQAQIQDFLAGRTVTLSPYIDQVSEGLRGSAAAEDLDALLQLARLYMTDVRPTEAAAERVLDELRPASERPQHVAEQTAQQTLAEATFGANDQFRAVPTTAQLDGFDLEHATDLYRQRFADASTFDFVLVGNVEATDWEALVGDYLGTLPGAPPDGPPPDDTCLDLVPPFPDRVVTETVRAGSGDQASLMLRFRSTASVGDQALVVADVLEEIVLQRFVDRIREELSATYSPSVEVVLTDRPTRMLATDVRVDAAPGDIEAIATALAEEIADLTQHPVSDDELDQAIQVRRRDYELANPEMIGAAVLWAEQHGCAPDLGSHRTQDIFWFWQRALDVQDVTAEGIQAVARQAFPSDRYVVVIQLPND